MTKPIHFFPLGSEEVAGHNLDRCPARSWVPELLGCHGDWRFRGSTRNCDFNHSTVIPRSGIMKMKFNFI